MYGQVYMIRHNVTNKVYIGKSSNPKRRYASHLQSLRRGDHHVEDLQSDFDKYGDNLSFSIIGDGDSPGQTEHELMDKYQSCVRSIGYNYNDPHTRKGKSDPLRQEYIETIIKQLRKTQNIAVLDYVCRLLQKAEKRP